MTTADLRPLSAPAVAPGHRLKWLLSDVATMTWRNLVALTRIPSRSSSHAAAIMLCCCSASGRRGDLDGRARRHLRRLPDAGHLRPDRLLRRVSTSIGLADDLQRASSNGSGPADGPLGRPRWAHHRRPRAQRVRRRHHDGVATWSGSEITTNFFLYLVGVVILLLFAYALSWASPASAWSAPNSRNPPVISFPILFRSPSRPPPSCGLGRCRLGSRHSHLQPVSVVVDAARSLMLGGAYTSTRHVLGALAWSSGCCRPGAARRAPVPPHGVAQRAASTASAELTTSRRQARRNSAVTRPSSMMAA